MLKSGVMSEVFPAASVSLIIYFFCSSSFPVKSTGITVKTLLPTAVKFSPSDEYSTDAISLSSSIFPMYVTTPFALTDGSGVSCLISGASESFLNIQRISFRFPVSSEALMISSAPPSETPSRSTSNPKPDSFNSTALKLPPFNEYSSKAEPRLSETVPSTLTLCAAIIPSGLCISSRTGSVSSAPASKGPMLKLFPSEVLTSAVIPNAEPSDSTPIINLAPSVDSFRKSTSSENSAERKSAPSLKKTICSPFLSLIKGSSGLPLSENLASAEWNPVPAAGSIGSLNIMKNCCSEVSPLVSTA